ncbi:MAG TPA: BON domain-containing protein [Longimicrobiaceae bacterium]
MARYDGGFGGNRGGGGRRPGGYGWDMNPWWGYGRADGMEGTRGLDAWGGGYDAGFRGREVGNGRSWRGAYDRGIYGSSYPEYGGYPGSGREGMDYGGRGRPSQGGFDRGGFGGMGGFGPGGVQRQPGAAPQRYDAGYRSYDRGWSSGRAQGGAGYDAGYAREPFMPEAAYLRHPEYETPSTYHQDRWERPGRYEIQDGGAMTDEEIRQEVRQRLYQDTWLRADEIEVTVSEGVVTLRGDVGDFLEARYAWDDAWESEGVRGVINNLTVNTDAGTERHGDMFAQDTGGEE